MRKLFGGKPLAVEKKGEGKSLVMIHGLGSTGNVWEPLVLELAGKFSVIRYDLEGAGRSPLSGSLSIDSWVADLVAILDTYAITRARFVGHSLGTLILQHFAVRYPERVAGLILIGVNRAPNEARREAVRQRAAKVRMEGIKSIADMVVKGGLSTYSYENKPELVGFVRELLLRQDTEGYAACLEAMASSNAADIARIESPVLVVAGDDDNVSPRANGEQFAKDLKNAQFCSLEKCGHWHPIEQPAALHTAVAAFLNGS